MPERGGTGSTDEEGFARGNADELYRIRDQIIANGPERLVVCSADHVYRLDLGDVLGTRREAGASAPS